MIMRSSAFTRNRMGWIVSSLIGALSLALLLLLSPPVAVQSQGGGTPTRTPTTTPTRAETLSVSPLILEPSPTRPRSALTSPTPTPTEVLPEAILTARALNQMINATLVAIPTDTPGPSTISLTGKPHFVEFYADWCGPCREMRPALRAMEAKYGEQVTFWFIDIDNYGSRPLVRKYGVEFIPFMALLDAEGKLVGTLEGLQTEADLDHALRLLIKP